MLALLLAFQQYRFPMPTPACGMPFHDASILQRVNPQVPDDVTFDGSLKGAAEVDLAPDGTVVRVRVTQSTGNAALDNAMMEAARRSTYQPKQDNCTAMPGTYLYQADFAAPGVLSPEESATAAPAPAANSCNHEGRVATSAHIVYPASLRVPQTTTALVRVKIGTSGELLDERIAQSTGNDTLDQSALDAAKRSVYAPKLVDCKPVVAAYIFKVVFQPH
ncbi:MAG TPA: TonB family protein [Candidatus Baltobacteraceae bacterium]|jgi:TonB family protein|nr:TonB family protein [Candidatus Baltobacteraceae bacterium]